MSHNPRQKKRNAQFRKKHFDAKGRAQGEKSKVEQKQASAAPAQQKIARQPQPEEAAAEGKQEEAQQTQEPSKYGRRKVASNWERYADIEGGDSSACTDESEEQLQQRLVQLLNLPSAAQDSHTWTSPSERGEGEATTFLTLNLSHLAESLSALPTHTRLALPADLLQRYGMSESDVLLPTQDKAHVDETSPSANLTPSSTEHASLTSSSANLTPSSTEHASLTSSVDLRPLLSKNRSRLAQTEPTFDFSAPSKLRPPPGLATPTTGSEVTEETPNSTSHHPLASRDHSVAPEDQGLDALLHGTSHVHLPTPRGLPAMADSGRVGDWKPTAVKREGLVTASMADSGRVGDWKPPAVKREGLVTASMADSGRVGDWKPTAVKREGLVTASMADSGRVGDWKPTAVKREGLVTASMAKGTVPTTADLDSVLDDLLA